MSQYPIDDVIFEALFQQAVEDNFNEEINELSSYEQLAYRYPFSQEFEVRMKKLLKKECRLSILKKFVYYSEKAAFICMLIFSLLFGTLLFFQEVRVLLKKTVIEWYDKFTTFIFDNDDAVIENKDWSLSCIPDGYVEGHSTVIGRITNIEYKNNVNGVIKFSYILDIGTTNISINNENHKIEKYLILGNEGFLVIATDEDFDSGIIWCMEGYSFSLWGKLHNDELKK